MKKARKQVTAGTPDTSDIPRAAGFNGFLRGLPGDRAFLPPSPADYLRQLDISVEISGRHDFAVRDKRIRLVRRRVHRIPRPTFSDDRETPLIEGTGCAEKC
jgi:hypothetical protein